MVIGMEETWARQDQRMIGCNAYWPTSRHSKPLEALLKIPRQPLESRQYNGSVVTDGRKKAGTVVQGGRRKSG